jgi:hypothetical protein
MNRRYRYVMMPFDYLITHIIKNLDLGDDMINDKI